MRAFTYEFFLPEDESNNIKGEAWGLSSNGFTERLDKGLNIGKYIINQVNFQISFYENLGTKTTKQLADTLVQFMKDFILQLENEISTLKGGNESNKQSLLTSAARGKSAG